MFQFDGGNDYKWTVGRISKGGVGRLQWREGDHSGERLMEEQLLFEVIMVH